MGISLSDTMKLGEVAVITRITLGASDSTEWRVGDRVRRSEIQGPAIRWQVIRNLRTDTHRDLTEMAPFELEAAQ